MDTPKTKTNATSATLGRKKRASTTCNACKQGWEHHSGISGTCKNLQTARTALQIICTWAAYDRGRFLDPKDTLRLCQKALRSINPEKKPNV